MSAGSVPAQPFPGGVIKVGSADAASVLAIQKRLNKMGCGPAAETGVFSADTVKAVELFQVRSADFQGHPLAVDGQVGPMTWAALFKTDVLRSAQPAATSLPGKVLLVAGDEVGTMEEPPGSNRGPKVNQYLASVDLNAEKGDFAWCAAFV